MPNKKTEQTNLFGEFVESDNHKSELSFVKMWEECPSDGDQFTLEAFYRFSISPGLQITPSLQFISDPLQDPTQDSITLFGLRTRIVF